MASAVANLRSAGGGNERFNEDALSWDSRPLVRKASEEAKKAIIAKCASLNWHPKEVLEIGCGTGILSSLIAPHVDRVVAIDAAEGMINVLEKKLKAADAPQNIVPVCVLLEDPEDKSLPPADSTNPDGSRQKFDLITSHLVLHHIPDLKSVLATMYGCLAPGGRVMLTDFEDFGPEAKRFHAQSRLGGVERHGIAVKGMTALMENVGFRNVNVTPEWTMTKDVEKFPGEFGSGGEAKDETQGEKLDFPFVTFALVKVSSEVYVPFALAHPATPHACTLKCCSCESAAAMPGAFGKFVDSILLSKYNKPFPVTLIPSAIAYYLGTKQREQQDHVHHAIRQLGESKGDTRGTVTVEG